ncbi:hypothetical protein [Psychroserpens ponticola]|uniref:Uncharacterized protein n=1 Tax=Psychroserpens ponticola TaxID=2932268 RepID=A0ABY7S332_9FLAO|nr:hypothetical protein [Psychroserpens ponticola]WCO03377.1 hypothetical protein MUN68_007695 [Psychroserpens ponticola]
MTENELKNTWNKIIRSFAIWIVLLIISVLYNRLGSKKPIPQIISLIASVYSVTLVFFYSVKIIKLRTYIKQLNDN